MSDYTIGNIAFDATTHGTAFDPAKYGRRNVAKMYKQIGDLRKAIQDEGTPAIQEAWDKIEEHVEFAYSTARVARIRELEARIAALQAAGEGLAVAANSLASHGYMLRDYCGDKDSHASIVLYDGRPVEASGRPVRSGDCEEELETPITGSECLFGIYVGHKSVKGALLQPVIQSKHFTDLAAASDKWKEATK